MCADDSSLLLVRALCGNKTGRASCVMAVASSVHSIICSRSPGGTSGFLMNWRCPAAQCGSASKPSIPGWMCLTMWQRSSHPASSPRGVPRRISRQQGTIVYRAQNRVISLAQQGARRLPACITSPVLYAGIEGYTALGNSGDAVSEPAFFASSALVVVSPS